MQQIILIFACLGIGLLLRWTGRVPDNASKALAGWVINVALPAVALREAHRLQLDAEWWLAAGSAWIGVALAVVLIVPLGRMLGWTRQRIGGLLLVAGWGNTSFVGLPMILAFAGKHWLGLGIFIDLIGSYLALSILGLAIATVASAGHFDWCLVAKRIATFPPFIAILVAFAIGDAAQPEWVTRIVDALAAVGLALRFDRLKGRLAPLGVGLGYRLFVAPLGIMLLYLALGRGHAMVDKVAMLEMAMPPMLGASLIAMDHDLEPDLVALVIGVGVPLSMLTAWGWWSIISLL